MILSARSTLFVVLLLLAGCSRDTGTLVGTVTIDGKLVTNGMVAVRTSDGRTANGNIHENGAYRIDAVPVGDVSIIVQTHPPSPAVLPPGVQPDSTNQPTAVVLPVPERYADFATSNLSTTVHPGENKHDLKLQK